MTLRELWDSKGMSPTEVAGAAGISTPTLYKMNRKERVHKNNVRAVCQVLGISEKEYNQLEPEK
jgi:DNA-binding Xre family transcriptional regulator